MQNLFQIEVLKLSSVFFTSGLVKLQEAIHWHITFPLDDCSQSYSFDFIYNSYTYLCKYFSVIRSKGYFANCLSCFRWIDEDDHVPLFFPIVYLIYSVMLDHHWSSLALVESIIVKLSRCNCYWKYLYGRTHHSLFLFLTLAIFFPMIPFFCLLSKIAPLFEIGQRLRPTNICSVAAFL